MRIPPNPHPIARLRNILLTVASVLTIWMLLCLTSCATPAVTETAVHPTSDRGAMDLREAIMRPAPIAPIPLARPPVLMHSRFQLRVRAAPGCGRSTGRIPRRLTVTKPSNAPPLPSRRFSMTSPTNDTVHEDRCRTDLDATVAKPLSQLVRQRRTELGLSLRTAGKVAGVDSSLVWQIEVGRTRNQTVLVLFGLSKALALPFTEICNAALLDVADRTLDIGRPTAVFSEDWGTFPAAPNDIDV